MTLQQLIQEQMQNRDEFYPDIETKFEHLLTHMSDKNKVTDQLVKILKQICNLELFYSSSLDKFANSISKLLIGKDPIKDILIIFERIIASKSEESEKLAHQIKDDLIPYLLESHDSQAQQRLKDRSSSIKQTRMTMQQKLRTLYSSENNFKKMALEIGNLPKGMSYNEKQKVLDQYRKKQDLFSDTIDSYNACIDDYMVKYSEICEQLSEIETKRKIHFRDAISKVVVFEINYLKNIEYNLSRYMESLNKMEGKLIIQDRTLGTNQPFYDSKDTGVIQLAKISNKNYIDHIAGKKKVKQEIMAEQQRIYQMRSTIPLGKVTLQQYHSICQEIFPILDFILRTNHHNLLIETVNLAKDLYIQSQGIKTHLLTSLLCHRVFGQQAFWSAYRKRLGDKIQKQQNSKAQQNDKKIRLETLLERDIAFLKNVDINPLISQILKEMSKLVSPKPSSSQSISNKSIKQTEDTNEKKKVKKKNGLQQLFF